jgi:uncharacterized protein YjbI with pentapeptide repeats/uncharacterized RDD family membrane protein YckC
MVQPVSSPDSQTQGASASANTSASASANASEVVQTTLEPTLEPIDVVSEVELSPERNLIYRRWGAWLAEASLLVASSLLPLTLGAALDTPGAKQVPLNPVLQSGQIVIAQSFDLPKSQLKATVSPLTNLCWSAALVMPFVLAGTQIYQLRKTGQTLAKRWFDLKVVACNQAALASSFTTHGTLTHPTLTWRQVIVRETSRWGLPIGMVYGISFLSGLSLSLAWLPILAWVCLVSEGATLWLNRDRRAWHERLAGTRIVGTGEDEISLVYQIAPDDIFEPVLQLNGELEPSLGAIDTSAVHASLAYESWFPATAVLDDARGGLTSIVLAPRASGFPSALVKRPYRFAYWRWLLGIGITMLTLGAVFLGIWAQRQGSARRSGAEADEMFVSLVNTVVTTPTNSAEQRAALLALAQLDDPRTAEFLANLLTQAETVEALAVLQQALVAQGLQALPALVQVNQTLQNDWAMASNSAEKKQLEQRLRASKRALTQLLSLHEGDLAGVSLNKVDLSRTTALDNRFRLRLAGLDLAGMQWRAASLTQANLQGAQLFDAGADGEPATFDDLTSDLSGSELKEVDLSLANLRGANLRLSNLMRADLQGANLQQADLTKSNLSNVTLSEADLSEANLSQANLVGANLARATLARATLTDARLGRVMGIGSVWQAAQLNNTDWSGADLTDSQWENAQLRGAIFDGATLQGADMRYVQLQEAHFRGTDLRDVTFTGAILTGADFTGAQFADAEAVVSDSFITAVPTGQTVLRFEGVDFSQAKNLDRQQLAYICQQGGLHPTCRTRP